jgi:predicted metal-dependent phosphotriesterase family hydrolase
MTHAAAPSPAPGVARTTAGDVPPALLGRVDYHEHLFQVSALLPGDELDDEQASTREAVFLRESGFETMVDATPVGLGRNPAALARSAEASGLRIVATTGAHRDEHYPGGHWLTDMASDRLAAMFLSELVEGLPEQDGPGETTRVDVRAGLVKMGVGYWRISAFERRVADSVAQAHQRTGAPVMVHTEFGTAAHEVLDLLETLGVAPGRVALAHVDRNPDPVLHAELASRGAFLGYDGAARARSWPESVVLDCLEGLASAGLAGSVLLGGDVARATRYVAYGGMPGLAYLGRRFVPRMRDRLGERLTDQVLVENPSRWLPWGR